MARIVEYVCDGPCGRVVEEHEVSVVSVRVSREGRPEPLILPLWRERDFYLCPECLPEFAPIRELLSK